MIHQGWILLMVPQLLNVVKVDVMIWWCDAECISLLYKAFGPQKPCVTQRCSTSNWSKSLNLCYLILIQCHSCMLHAAIFMTFVQKSCWMFDLRQVYGPEPGAPDSEWSQWRVGRLDMEWLSMNWATGNLRPLTEVLMIPRGSLERGKIIIVPPEIPCCVD